MLTNYFLLFLHFFFSSNMTNICREKSKSITKIQAASLLPSSSSSSSSLSLVSSSFRFNLLRMIDCSIAATVQSTTLSASRFVVQSTALIRSSYLHLLLVCLSSLSDDLIRYDLSKYLLKLVVRHLDICRGI